MLKLLVWRVAFKNPQRTLMSGRTFFVFKVHFRQPLMSATFFVFKVRSF